MHVHHHQQLNYKYFDFSSGQEQNSKVPLFSGIALSHICWLSYRSGTYFITTVYFLTPYLLMFLVLRWPGANLSISGFLIIVAVLIFEDL